jgi:hypothetical protein
MKKRIGRKREIGQALVEFAFTLPILLLFAAGVFDFGRVFFVYAQASNNVRRAVREAPVIGYDGAADPGYLDCQNMIGIAEDVVAADSQPTVTVTYFDDTSTNIGSCTKGNNSLRPADSALSNGDYIQVKSTATVTPIFFTFIGQSFNFEFIGQRTIVKTFSIGATDCALTYPLPLINEDADYDGLCDQWEINNFGHTNYIATDNPAPDDGDACNLGEEETHGTSPFADDCP